MQRRVRMVHLAIFALAVSCAIMVSAGRCADIEDGTLLFIGQDPTPRSTGAVAYTVDQKRLKALPEWGPDTHEALPPLGISAAVSVAIGEITDAYNFETQRLQLSEIVLMKAPVVGRNIWYYVVVQQVNIAENPFHPKPSDYIEMRMVVLMDGKVLKPSCTDLSRQIRFQGFGAGAAIE